MLVPWISPPPFLHLEEGRAGADVAPPDGTQRVRTCRTQAEERGTPHVLVWSVRERRESDPKSYPLGNNLGHPL